MIDKNFAYNQQSVFYFILFFRRRNHQRITAWNAILVWDSGRFGSSQNVERKIINNLIYTVCFKVPLRFFILDVIIKVLVVITSTEFLREICGFN